MRRQDAAKQFARQRSNGKEQVTRTKSKTPKMETLWCLMLSQAQTRQRESGRQSHDPSIEALARTTRRLTLSVFEREKISAKRNKDAITRLHELSWVSHDAHAFCSIRVSIFNLSLILLPSSFLMQFFQRRRSQSSDINHPEIY